MHVDDRQHAAENLGDLPDALSSMWKRYALKHIIDRARGNENTSFFSMRLQKRCLHKLTHLMNSIEDDSQDELETIYRPVFGIDYTVESVGEQLEAWPVGVQDMLFMKPIALDLHAAIRAMPEQGGKLLETDLGVACHKIGMCDIAAKYITVCADPCKAREIEHADENALVLSLSSLSIDDLKQIWKWEMTGEHKASHGGMFILDPQCFADAHAVSSDNPDDVPTVVYQDVLLALLKDIFENSTGYVDDDSHPDAKIRKICHDALEEKCLIQQTASDSAAFVFTDLGKLYINVEFPLERPRRLIPHLMPAKWCEVESAKTKASHDHRTCATPRGPRDPASQPVREPRDLGLQFGYRMTAPPASEMSFV